MWLFKLQGKSSLSLSVQWRALCNWTKKPDTNPHPQWHVLDTSGWVMQQMLLYLKTRSTLWTQELECRGATSHKLWRTCCGAPKGHRYLDKKSQNGFFPLFCFALLLRLTSKSFLSSLLLLHSCMQFKRHIISVQSLKHRKSFYTTTGQAPAPDLSVPWLKPRLRQPLNH